MKCPKCGSSYQSRVTDKRDTPDDIIRRHRECLKCGERYTTYEIKVSRCEKLLELEKITADYLALLGKLKG